MQDLLSFNKRLLEQSLRTRASVDVEIARLQAEIGRAERENDERAPEAERFRVLVADCAWKFGDKLPGSGRGSEKHYNCQTVDEIAGQHLPPLRDDAILFFWRVAAGHEKLDLSLAESAYRVVRAWGFVPKSEIAWFKRGSCSRCKGQGQIRSRRYVEQTTIPGADAKDRVFDGLMEQKCPACDGQGEKDAFGMGRIVRGQHEVCLIGVRGRGADHVLSRSVRSAFETIENSEIVAPTGEHSEKPDVFYDLVETLFPGPYFELHARRTRPGWTMVGHQLDPAGAAVDSPAP